MSGLNARQTAVRAVLLEFANKPFRYGETDCAHFASECVKVMTGNNYGEQFDYQTEEEALQILEKYGGLTGLFTHFLGEPIAASDLEDGDPCLITIPSIGEFIGFYLGGSAMAKTMHGTVTIQSSRIIHGWGLKWQQPYLRS